MKRTAMFSFFVMVSTVIFSACTSNIQHIQPPENSVAKQKTYYTSFEKVWNATQRALSETETFKVLDKSSKIMVTEFRTIDAKELSIAQTYFLGKTYKSSYTINFLQNNSDKTDVLVAVKLHAVQVILMSREEKNENVEAYLRKNIFDKISANLDLIASSSIDENSSIKNQNEMSATEMTVSEMQQRLSDIGYQPGPADGIAGKRTIVALKKFQSDNGLLVTGNLNSETISKLRN